jgi:uncharacterized damage-inducible protein DinB
MVYCVAMSRGRIYKIESLAGFGNSKVARAAAFLEEAAERLIDVLAAADHRQLHFRPEGSYLSMAGLSKHLTWGEMGWIGRLTGRPVPDAVRKTVGDSGPKQLPDLPEDDATAEELIATIHTMRAEYTFPVLSRITDYQALVTYDNGRLRDPKR